MKLNNFYSNINCDERQKGTVKKKKQEKNSIASTTDLQDRFTLKAQHKGYISTKMIKTINLQAPFDLIKHHYIYI